MTLTISNEQSKIIGKDVLYSRFLITRDDGIEIIIPMYSLLDNCGVYRNSDDGDDCRVVDQEELLKNIKRVLEKDSGKKLNTMRMELR